MTSSTRQASTLRSASTMRDSSRAVLSSGPASEPSMEMRELMAREKREPEEPLALDRAGRGMRAAATSRSSAAEKKKLEFN